MWDEDAVSLCSQVFWLLHANVTWAPLGLQGYHHVARAVLSQPHAPESLARKDKNILAISCIGLLISS